MSTRNHYNPLTTKSILAFVFKEERRSSVVLILAALCALLLANSGWSSGYFDILGRYVTLGTLKLDVRHWINEALMALFFLVVALEVKRELIDGELRTWKKAAFPLYAALGGMIFPAVIFVMFNPARPENSGWGIPMATDIAIAIGVLALLGKRIPRVLRVFLLSLAIIDDLGSIVVISIFYNRPTNMVYLLIAITISVGLALSRKLKYWPVVFTALGLALLYCLLGAGVSGTIAGVIVAVLMPLTTSRSDKPTLQASEFIERMLIPVTSFVIVPLFVLANAGLDFSGISFVTPEGNTVFVGVLLGLLVGKPLGIFIATWIADRINIANKPTGISWRQVAGVGSVAGIGFTISLLITDLAFKNKPEYIGYSMLGIFLASVLSAVTGLVLLGTSKNLGR